MKNSYILTCFLASLFHLSPLLSTPTSLFWTNCITDIQPQGNFHFGLGNYFTVYNRRHHGSSFAPDVGLTYGLFDFTFLKGEVGIDYMGGTSDPLYFNGKTGFDENVLFQNAPAFNVGFFNLGTRIKGSHSTNQNVVDLILGKTLPFWLGGGRLFIAIYSGSRALGNSRQGFMAGYEKAFCRAIDCTGRIYYKWLISADYASGHNALGGGGIAVTHYFNPKVKIETGPVFFNDSSINGSWKWGLQLSVDMP